MPTYRCANCGDLLDFTVHSLYPGTTDKVITFEPCCSPDYVEEALNQCYYEIENSTGPDEVADSARTFLEELRESLKKINFEDLHTEVIESHIDDLECYAVNLTNSIEESRTQHKFLKGD